MCGLFRKNIELFNHDFALDRDTLRNGRAFWKDAGECGIVPPRREMHQAVGVKIGIDEAGNGGKRQIGTIDRVRDEERIAGRKLDRPEIVELDDEAITVEKRRALDLNVVVIIDRRAG